MNKLIMKQVTKKKQKTKQQQQRITQTIIQDKLLRHFQYHIGEENKTTSEEIFQVVLGINSSAVDSYARFYWFDIVQKIMRKLRREDKCFIVKKDKNYFVLKSLEECTHYKNQCDGAIDKMEKAKIRAEEWVENEKWKNMNIPTESEDEDSEDEEEDVDEVHRDEVVVINKPKEINDYKNKLKTKVIKLWKSEEE